MSTHEGLTSAPIGRTPPQSADSLVRRGWLGGGSLPRRADLRARRPPGRRARSELCARAAVDVAGVPVLDDHLEAGVDPLSPLALAFDLRHGMGSIRGHLMFDLPAARASRFVEGVPSLRRVAAGRGEFGKGVLPALAELRRQPEAGPESPEEVSIEPRVQVLDRAGFGEDHLVHAGQARGPWTSRGDAGASPCRRSGRAARRGFRQPHRASDPRRAGSPPAVPG